MMAAVRAWRLPTSQVALGILLAVLVGGLYVLYENWARAGILFLAAGGAVALPFVLSSPLLFFFVFCVGLFGNFSELIPGFSLIIALAVSFAGIVFCKFSTSNYSWRFTPVLLTTLIFAAWYYFSLVWMAELLPISNYYLISLTVSLFVMMSSSELVRDPKQWRIMMIFIGLGIIVTAISSVVSVFTFLTKGVDFHDTGAVKQLEVARYFGHWGGPNALGHTLAPFTPLFVPYLNRTEKKRMRLFAAFVVFCGIMAVAMSLSRAAIIALLFALLIVFMKSRYRKVLFLSAAAAIAIVVLVLPVNLLGRLGGSSFGRGDASVNERSFIGKAALGVALGHMPFGAGFSGFNFYYADYMDRTAEVYHAHNAYLHILAETGLPGLLLYLGVFAAALWSLLRRLPNVRRDSQADELRIALLACVLSIAIAALFEHNLGWTPHWFLFALAGIYPHVFGEPKQPAKA